MAEQKLTLKQSLAALWQQAETTFATKTDVGKVSTFAYGVSSTAVGTAAKVITLQGVSDWTLKSGAIIAVSFTAGANTANNPTFNVNGTGAKRVKYNGALIANANKDFAGTKLVQFYYYDGSNWVWFFRDYGDEVVAGYFNQTDKKFYEEQSFTTLITPTEEGVYIDKSTGKVYVSKNDGQDHVKLLGGDNVVRGYYDSSSGKFYLNRTGTSPNYTYSNEVEYDDNKLYIDKGDGKVYTSTGTNIELLFDTQNYYTKSQVDGLISGIHQFAYQVEADRSIIATTPTAANMYIIYLLPISGASSPNTKDEYIAIRSGTEGNYTYAWEMIGTTETDLSGYVPTSRKVNGHALTSDVTVTKSDVGLGNVTNDAQVKRTEMGAASGVATLDSNRKVPTSQLPTIPLANLPTDVKNVVVGYYVYDTTNSKGKFYLTRSGSSSSYTYSDEVAATNASETTLYRDSPSNLLYVTDGSEFVILNGDYFAVTQTELNEILGIS